MSDNPRPIEYHAGDARPLDFPIYDEDPLDPGEPDLSSPVDLSAATSIRFGLAPAVTEEAHFIKTLAGGDITVVTGDEAVDNVVRVALAKGDTSGLSAGKLYYEIEVVEGGDDWTGPHGPFRLKASLLK